MKAAIILLIALAAFLFASAIVLKGSAPGPGPIEVPEFCCAPDGR